MCSECRCDRVDGGLYDQQTTVVQYRMGDINPGERKSNF